MNAQELLKNAQALQDEIQANRRELHRHPELGLDMVFTKAFVVEKLKEMGYEPADCGEGGVVVTVGGKKGGKCFLIRGDMDALPVDEESGVDYASETPGKMHACGHDTHTAMMLGAAKLLKTMEDELEGTVKLMFQPGEETLQGAVAMVEAGVLENPHVDAAMMIHSSTGLPIPKGMFLVMEGGYGSASCDQYKITVQGKGGHGAMPHLSIDPVTAAAHIHVALAELHSRELESTTFGVVTTGMVHAGVAPNVIADTVEMEGTIRTGDEKVEEMLMRRVREIAENVAKAYRCEAKVEYTKHCPPMIADDIVAAPAVGYMKEMFGEAVLPMSRLLGGNKIGGGSEDFAFVSSKVPATSLGFSMSPANSPYPQHHPKAVFEDDVIHRGSAAYAYVAARWLEDHK